MTLVTIDIHDPCDHLTRIDARDGFDPERLVRRLPLPLPVTELIAGDSRAALREFLQHASQELADFRRAPPRPGGRAGPRAASSLSLRRPDPGGVFGAHTATRPPSSPSARIR